MAWKWVRISLKSWMVSWYKNKIVRAGVSNYIRHLNYFGTKRTHSRVPGLNGEALFLEQVFSLCLPIVDQYKFIVLICIMNLYTLKYLSSLGNQSMAGSYKYHSWQLQFWDTFFSFRKYHVPIPTQTRKFYHYSSQLQLLQLAAIVLAYNCDKSRKYHVPIPTYFQKYLLLQLAAIKLIADSYSFGIQLR